ncbi:hypothetical protein [Gimesia panareensis]|uniref:Uncharacterized protein n=1 Tax=Gimesia panareensis TaxID=2527978 RepID=A0A517QD22_9PLAN|nr:hypothetical protein [Gimesia panareensis]QDT29536.1 hypothetical protein Enr10x_48910 [Gimesia panareensis]QDU52579.1 hypothetical protein Pan110_49590 [Gimesia panareensis]
MGSFANSVHVRSNDSDEVISAIQTILQTDGYEPTDEEPDEEAMWGMPSAHRALHVSQPVNGWVNLLDSDLLGSANLSAELSLQLQSPVMQFFVNDSDSWAYVLYERGDESDGFDSSGGLMGGGMWDESMPETIPFAAEGNMEQKALEAMQQIEAAMPAEIRAIQQKINQGQASQDEFLQLSQWIQEHSRQFMDQFRSDIVHSMEQPERVQEDLSPHIEPLRPLLVAGVTDERVLKLLDEQAVFAEETLAAFMPLIGVPPIFANLSYRYLEEITTDELAAEGVRMQSHLKYKTDMPMF